MSSPQIPILLILSEEDSQLILRSWSRKSFKTDEYKQRLVFEYLRYITIKISFPDEIYSPSLVIDSIWHEHILFTRQYQSFSYINNNNAFIHHEPFTGSYQHYLRTLSKYKEMFNEPPPQVYWPLPRKS